MIMFLVEIVVPILAGLVVLFTIGNSICGHENFVICFLKRIFVIDFAENKIALRRNKKTKLPKAKLKK